MTLDESIRINMIRDTEEDEGNDDANYKANQLGIEALKKIKQIRVYHKSPKLYLLPGETITP